MAQVRVLESSPHELVVWKPPGLASELPRDPDADSLLARLKADGHDKARLVHRLDAAACGLMLVALSRDAAAHYAAEIAARRWHKRYVAAVTGTVASAEGLLGDHKAYLANDGRKARVVRSGGKPSFLTITHVERAADHLYVLVRLHTGRFHQIRVMLAALGSALVGDALYGTAAPARFYLEHVALGARPFGSGAMKVWSSPANVDRPVWSPALHAAVANEAAEIRATPE